MELKIYDVRLKLSSEGRKEELQAPYEIKFQDLMHVSSLFIPFSIIFRKKTPLVIYSGNELIPFEERDSIFKQILKNEFDYTLKEFVNQMKET